MVVTDIPQCRDDVALDALRPLGCGWNFSLCDALRPIREYFQRSVMPHCAQRSIHGVAANTTVQTAIPGIEWSLDRRLPLVHIIQRARQLVSELMTEVAAGFERVYPVILRQHAGTHAISLGAGPGEETLCRRLHEGQPVISR